MSANLYDRALVSKLQNWIKDDTITITSPDETKRLFQYKADTTNDKPIQLPLIALRRKPTISILNVSKKPLMYDGKLDSYSIESGKTSELNAIPIQLDYNIDIYTRYEEECLEYVRNFVYNIINYPKLTVEIPYNNANIKHNSNIRLLSEIQDNSDIPERLVPGQFTRYTLSIYVDDAYLWNYKIKDIKTIEIEDITENLDSK